MNVNNEPSRTEEHREWRKQNAEHFRNYQREYKRKRRATDSEFREKENARMRVASYYLRHRDIKGLPEFEARPDTCDVCGVKGRICMDHCHEKMAFRGWLCSDCNSALGLVKDNPEILLALARYLEQ